MFAYMLRTVKRLTLITINPDPQSKLDAKNSYSKKIVFYLLIQTYQCTKKN